MAQDGHVDPAFLSHVTAVEELLPEEEHGGRDTLDLSRLSAGGGAAGDDASQLRVVLATYSAHATCALQATRGLKHYIAKLEELVGQRGVPPAWEVRFAAQCSSVALRQRAALCRTSWRWQARTRGQCCGRS